jgi:hypothetical protein
MAFPDIAKAWDCGQFNFRKSRGSLPAAVAVLPFCPNSGTCNGKECKFEAPLNLRDDTEQEKRIDLWLNNQQVD